jgi:hypothetical protein
MMGGSALHLLRRGIKLFARFEPCSLISFSAWSLVMPCFAGEVLDLIALLAGDARAILAAPVRLIVRHGTLLLGS